VHPEGPDEWVCDQGVQRRRCGHPLFFLVAKAPHPRAECSIPPQETSTARNGETFTPRTFIFGTRTRVKAPRRERGSSELQLVVTGYYTFTYTQQRSQVERSRPQQPQAPQQRIDLLRLGRRSGPRRDSIEERLLGRAAGEDLIDDDGPLASQATRSAYDLLFVS
jgi:hypothetical protein